MEEKIIICVDVTELEHNGNHYGRFFFSETQQGIEVYGYVFYRCYDWYKDETGSVDYKLSLQDVSIEYAVEIETDKDVEELIEIEIY